MKWKNIGLKLTTAAVTAAMGLQMAVQPMQAAAASTQYLSEVIISYGRTDDEAKNWLTQNGYKVVNQNLNEGGEGGSDAFSWLGLASEKRSVYLGYKTTTNPEEAITDMKIMNMNGGYSYEAYEKVLKELEQEKTHFLENIMAALSEYRANYKAGKVKAKIAHDNLNKFKDDDSGQLMGDLLLNTLRTEDEAAWEADKTQHADMVTILMQGNSTCVSEIMQNLAFAADTADDSFVNRAIAAANAEESPFDTFFNAYMEKHPDYTKDEAVTELIQLYDDDAKMFASSLIGLQNYLANYTMSQLSIEATPEEAKAYFEEHDLESESTWAGAANMFSLLTHTEFSDTSLANYLIYTDDDYLSDSVYIEEYAALNLPQRAKLYPFIAQMSAGQRCLLEYTSLDKMLTFGLMDSDTWAETYEKLQDAEFGAVSLEPCSVYAEVNRNDFQVGEIAVTNAAQGKAASLGEQAGEGMFDVGISYLTAGLFVGSIAATVAGIAIAAKYWTNLPAAAANWNNVPAAVGEVVDAATDRFQKAILEYNQDLLQQGKNIFAKDADFSTHFWWASGMGKDGLRKAGADEAMIAILQPQKTQIDGVEYILLSDGNTISTQTGQAGPFNAEHAQKVKDAIKGPNPDVLREIQQKEQAAQELATQKAIEIAKGNIDDAFLTSPGIQTSFNNALKNYLKENGLDYLEPPYLDIPEDKLDDFAQFLDSKNLIHFEKGDQEYKAGQWFKLHRAKLKELTGSTAQNAANNIDDALAAATQNMQDFINNNGALSRNWSDTMLYLGYDTNTLPSQLSDDDFQKAVDYIEENFKEDGTFDRDKFSQLRKDCQELNKSANAKNNAQQIADKVDDAVEGGEDGIKKATGQADDVMTSGSGSTFWKWFGVGMAIVGLAMAAYSAYAAISEMNAYYHQEMLPIPRKMVDLGYYDDGSHCYIYYDCTKCNRNEMSMGNEALGDYGDLNGDVMKQWLALYTTKDKRAGSPIQAGFTVKKGTTNIPVRTVPLSFFGFDYAVNMTDTKFTYNNNLNGIYLYYKQTASKYTGTVETGNALVTTGVLSAIGGAGICGLIAALVSKRKKKQPEGTPTAA